MKSANNAPDIDIGDLQRTYSVIREIGRGGMGSVVLARHREALHYVAIKIASTDKLDPEALARFSREAYLMARFSHPNIVRLYNIGQIGKGRVGIIMEYVRGRSLAQLLSEAKGGLPFDRCLSIVRDLGHALAHAHANGVIHRDVKPQNVLVEDETGRAKLADFGIAKVNSEGTDVTATGAALGTPAYMSPEQIDGAVLDGRSDAYSLGVVAWEAITGQRPWAGESLFKLLFKQKHESLPVVTTFRPDTPPRLVLALEGALAKDRAHRWASVNDMVAQLESDHPTPALLERRERAASVLRVGSAGVATDAATIPVPRRAEREAAERADSPHATESTIPVHPHGRAPGPGSGPDSAPSTVPPGAPSEARPRWRQALPFGVGLLIGGVAAVFVLRQFAPAAGSAAPVAQRPSPALAVPRVVVDSATSLDSAAPGPTNEGKLPPPQPSALSAATVAPVGVDRSTMRAAPDPIANEPDEVAGPAFVRAGTTLEQRASAYAMSIRARDLVYDAKWTETERLVDSALTIDPSSGAAYALRARLHMARGEMREAWTDIELASRTGARWEALALSTALRARDRSAAEARARLRPFVEESLTPRRTLGAERAVSLAMALVQVGDSSTALTLLEQATTADPRLGELMRDPLLDPLRASTRFQQVLQRSSGSPDSTR